MKKSIQKLVFQLQSENDGKLSGGFGSIKGGMSLLLLSTNPSCTNRRGCDGTNTGVCTNLSTSCADATNYTCTNSLCAT